MKRLSKFFKRVLCLGSEFDSSGGESIRKYFSIALMNSTQPERSDFTGSYDSSGDAFGSWRDANYNTNGRNAVAIQKGTKYGYFVRTTFLELPSYTWTEKAKVGDWTQ
jgi:hypothetical protein